MGLFSSKPTKKPAKSGGKCPHCKKSSWACGGRCWDKMDAKEKAKVKVTDSRGHTRTVTKNTGNNIRRGIVWCGRCNCLAGETLVMTPDGDVPIAELAGTTARLLSRRGQGRAAGGPGRWVDADVRSFGSRPLRRVALARCGVTREIFATPEHRWILDGPDRARQERITDDLRSGYRLASIYPQSVATQAGISSVGVAHGIVYGDGTAVRRDARVMLCGDKNASLLRYFPEPKVAVCPDGLLVTQLPRSWKRLPSLDEGPSYLLGFLAGYFAADGDVTKKGAPRLWASNYDTLVAVRVLCTRLGIATAGIRTVKRIGINDEVSALHHIHLSARSLTDAFFLIPEHRDRFASVPTRRAPARWLVASVEPTDRVEEVFCAVVPGTECFALADNLLTGNCRVFDNGTCSNVTCSSRR